MCPVDMFVLYTSKLNKSINHFWQRPKRGKLHYTDPIWYDKMRVGHGPIENFMAQLSLDANLSRRYTNHSIRSTVMGILGEIYEGRHVIGLSGHKNEGSIKLYARKLSNKKKLEMCNTLADLAQPPKESNENTAPPTPKFKFKNIAPKPATVSKAPEHPKAAEIPAAENQVPFDLQPLDHAPPDDVLINFLKQFDPITEDPPPENPVVQQPILQPVPQPNNLMNISNIQNVQNLANPTQRIVPNMYFGGNSSVTINYNFAPQQ